MVMINNSDADLIDLSLNGMIFLHKAYIYPLIHVCTYTHIYSEKILLRNIAEHIMYTTHALLTTPSVGISETSSSRPPFGAHGGARGCGSGEHWLNILLTAKN